MPMLALAKTSWRYREWLLERRNEAIRDVFGLAVRHNVLEQHSELVAAEACEVSRRSADRQQGAATAEEQRDRRPVAEGCR